MLIRELSIKDANAVAALHISGISTGFISSLGQDFVAALYEAIAESEYSFGFVAVENDKVLGFVAFTTDLNSLYKSIMVKKMLLTQNASMCIVSACSGINFTLSPSCK